MAKKTKAQLEKEVTELEQNAEYWMAQAKESQKDYNEKAAMYATLSHDYNCLAGKHDDFVARHRTICAAHERQVEILQENLNNTGKECGELKARLEAKEARIAVCETAMRSMTIHILILEQQQKGK